MAEVRPPDSDPWKYVNLSKGERYFEESNDLAFFSAVVSGFTELTMLRLTLLPAFWVAILSVRNIDLA